MRRHLMRTYCGIAAAAVALAAPGISTAAAAATSAAPSMGPPSYSSAWAGYQAGGGRWFRYISTTVTVPPRVVPGSYGGGATIWLSGTGSVVPAQIYAGPGGGAGSVRWNGGQFTVSPRVGDRLQLSIYYDRHGHDYLTVTDLTRHVTQTVRMNVPKMTYLTARLFVTVDNTVTPPAADTRLWRFTDSRLTTYSGVRGTLVGPWTTSQTIVTTTSTASGTLIASPSGLSNGGRDFTAWFRALPHTYTSAFAGYADSGGPFRFVSTTLTVPLRRVPGEAALVILGYNGGATPRPYTNIEVLAGGGAGSISYQASTASGSFTSGTFAIQPKPGDQLTVSIYYDQHGHDYFTVTDTTRHTTQTVKVTAVFYRTSGYNTAEILAMINNGAVTPPAADVQLWKFTGSHVTSYSGEHGTILGPWATSQYTDTTTETAAGATVMSASVLSRNGQNFAAWLRHK
jgi:hypothetical protein